MALTTTTAFFQTSEMDAPKTGPALSGTIVSTTPLRIRLAMAAYLARFTESLVGYTLLGVAAIMLLVGALWLKKTVAITF